MNESDARDLAYSWHGGMWSPLYAFASSGIVEDRDALLAEIQSSFPGTRGPDKIALMRLVGFVYTRLTPRADGTYLAPWARSMQEK